MLYDKNKKLLILLFSVKSTNFEVQRVRNLLKLDEMCC